jgi:hypothetical protein
LKKGGKTKKDGLPIMEVHSKRGGILESLIQKG